MDRRSEYETQANRGLPTPIAAAACSMLLGGVAVNLIFATESWLSAFNNAWFVSAAMAGVVFVYFCITSESFRAYLSSRVVDPEMESYRYDGAHFGGEPLSDAPVRAGVLGQPVNARVDQKTLNPSSFIIEPYWRHYLVCAIFTVPVFCILIGLVVVSPVSTANPEYLAIAPENVVLRLIAITPVPLRFFIGLFCFVAIFLLLIGLRKPVRCAQFSNVDDTYHVWHQWVFGLKKCVIESGKVSEIAALQLLNYNSAQTVSTEFKRTGKRSSDQSNTYSEIELNIVHRNGARETIVNHRNKKQIRRDAIQFSKWLDKPLYIQISTVPVINTATASYFSQMAALTDSDSNIEKNKN